MKYPSFFEPKNSLNLFGLEDNLQFLLSVYNKKNFPKVLMLTGNKGSGKSTLINHFLYSIFDQTNYEINTYTSDKSPFHQQYTDGIFSNIIYINGSDFSSVRIEDIRYLKTKILQSPILNKDRFIVLDDVEQFNVNSLNALLKIIEEPGKDNCFILINNKSKPLLETIKSRSLEIKIILREDQRLEIINELINFYKIELSLDSNISQLSPGNFIKFNYLCNEYNISLENDFITNLSLLLSLYKKSKDNHFIDLAFFVADIYIKDLLDKNIYKKDRIYEIKNFILDNLNKFLLYNINQNAFISIVTNKLNNE